MTIATSEPLDDVEAFHDSPIHDVKPVDENPRTIDISAIEIDETNPGSQTESRRYMRREESIRDSYDILGGVVYPIVVCEQPGDPSRFIHVDGFGRLSELMARGATKVKAFVYPPLTLEQRILLRETLNSAQEPFDVASIIRDLQELARERNIDVRNTAQIKSLVRDLPKKVRAREKDLVVLARWDPTVVAMVGENYGPNSTSIGMDKIKELTSVLDVMSSRHPEIVQQIGGELALSRKLGKMYQDKKFQRGRSQTGIRRVVETFKTLPENSEVVRTFFRKELDYQTLPAPDQTRDPVKLCEELAKGLVTMDAASLTDEQVRTLARTRLVLNEVLAQVGL